MTRGQWIAVVLLILLVLIAVAIGVILWMRKRAVVVVEPSPVVNAPIVNGVPTVITGAVRKVNNMKQVKKPASTGATYREILGKRA
jgi:hypothetical protein